MRGKNVDDLLPVVHKIAPRKSKAVFQVPVVIRVITTGSMQTRFSISEEVAIISGVDDIAKVLLSRLFNAKNINLDLIELQEGIAYIVQYLDTLGALHMGVTPSVRLDQLLVDGTTKEKFLG